MPENTVIISSHHLSEAVTESVPKLSSNVTDVGRVFPYPSAQRSLAPKTLFTRCTDKEEADPLYSQLWHACAGSSVTLPRMGSRVVYFPQGHIEQVAACTKQGVDMQMPQYNLPSQILCHVLNMTLSAERETDEVYAQMTLVPEAERRDGSEDVDETPFSPKHNPMFIKVLTASDTSTHGGFSVPRRAAEECFPPLDFQQSPPTQGLIAKDLHGEQWKFRHIYRGHPKRHLLTTGWSIFVSRKRLVAGDAVIFLRGESGELRLGVRRSIRQQSSVTSSSLLSSHSMHLGVLAAAAHAVSTKSMFSIFYNPRTSPAEFVIPYSKYVSALKNNLSVGMRFKMRFETEESSERMFIGTITGVGDFDATHWPNSMWRCLKVEWDEQSVCERQGGVSPWEIEPFNVPTVLNFPEPRVTRLRFCNSSPADLRMAGGSNSQSDSGPSVKHQRILQGSHDLQSAALVIEEVVEVMANANRPVITDDCNVDTKLDAENCRLLGRSDLQMMNIPSIEIPEMAQEFQVPLRVPSQTFTATHNQIKLLTNYSNENARLNDSLSYQPSTIVANKSHEPNLHLALTPQGTQKSQNRSRQEFPHNKNKNDLTLWWSPDSKPTDCLAQSSVLPVAPADWFTNIRSTSLLGHISDVEGLEDSSSVSQSKVEKKMLHPEPCAEHFPPSLRAQQDGHVQVATDTQFKLFGFSLSSSYIAKDSQQANLETPATNDSNMRVLNALSTYHSSKEVDNMSNLPLQSKQDCESLEGMDHEIIARDCKVQDFPQLPLRTCVKVYKQGAVGRAVDISRFEGYDDLIKELSRLFKIGDVLNEPGSGWQLVYIDNEGDMLLVGDDPWPEFCVFVHKIRILSPHEVDTMARGSHLEEDQSTREIFDFLADQHDSSAPATPSGRYPSV